MFSHIQIQHMNSDKSAENYILFAYSHYSLDSYTSISILHQNYNILFNYIKFGTNYKI